MCYSKFTGNAQRRIHLKERSVVPYIIGASAAKPHMDDTSVIFHILGECRALWGERSEAWYRVTVADAEAATYVKRVYVDYL